jgi:hypothetical protein
VSDLSLRHGPIGDLFPQSGSRADAAYRLSEEQLSRFAEHGYVAGIRVLNETQIGVLRHELDQLMTSDHGGQKLWYEYRRNASMDPDLVMLHASGAWRIARGFHDLLWHPAITVPARQLLGGPVRFLQDQLFCKPPIRGGRVSWHQDYSYWTFSQPMGHLTCWIALDDTRIENGCLCYVPGSHHWGLLPITGLTGAMEAVESVLTPEQKVAFAPKAIELQRGEASFHHPLILHGSHDNRSSRPRRATVINLMRDGTRAAENEPETDGLPAFMTRKTEETIFYPTDRAPRGRVLNGRYFPLVG